MSDKNESSPGTNPQLSRLFADLKQNYLPNLGKSAEARIKDPNSIYTSYKNMPGAWHGFEGTQEEALEHIIRHFAFDHPDSKFIYDVQWSNGGVLSKNGGTQLEIMANTSEVGYQHFVWRTDEDKYILMLSDLR